MVVYDIDVVGPGPGVVTVIVVEGACVVIMLGCVVDEDVGGDGGGGDVLIVDGSVVGKVGATVGSAPGIVDVS